MTSLLKKNVKFQINDEFQKSFETCKSLLINAPLLQYPDFTKSFILTTDASNVALGAVLSQGNIGTDKPIAYASRTLNNAESRYSAIEKELLAVIWAVKHFRPYLYGRKFTIYTDHRPLAWLYSLKEPNSKLTRWRLRLQEYDFEIIYKSGKQNLNADALSRILLNKLKERIILQTNDTNEINDIESDDSLIAYVGSDNDNSMDSEETLSASEIDLEDLDLVDTIDLSPFEVIEDPIDIKPHQIILNKWFKNNYEVNNSTRGTCKIMEVNLPCDPDIMKNFLKDHIKNNKKYYVYFVYNELKEIFYNVAPQLFQDVTFIICNKRVTIIEDEIEQKRLILLYHEGKTCHRGIKETLKKLSRNYYWPKMKETVSAVIGSCDLCKRMKYDRHPLNLNCS
jgi:hypothetical protein